MDPVATRRNYVGMAISLAVGAAALAALAVSFAALPHDGDCDNMAGECLRHRQGHAITLIEAACLAAAVTAAVCFVRQRSGRSLSAVAIAALVLCGAIATAVLVVQPVDHLNNRWTGWLSDSHD
jgi:hypothetical protein